MKAKYASPQIYINVWTWEEVLINSVEDFNMDWLENSDFETFGG